MSKAPIGVFDSGVGGLSIVQAVRRALPHENIIYLADNAHFPYGQRGTEEIRRLAKEATQQLVDLGCKMVVIACNTATTAAIQFLREVYPEVPIVGVVPMVKPAAALTKSGIVAILVTPATLSGSYYQELKQDYARAVTVIDQACPDWVELAENGQIDEEKIREPLERVLARGADVIVLGCTHFPLLLPVIERIVGGKAVIMHPAQAVAKQINKVLEEKNILKTAGAGTFEYKSTGAFDKTKAALIELFGNTL